MSPALSQAQPNAEVSSQNFFAKLEAAIEPFNLLRHPFYQAWSAGELTREDLRNYAAEYFHHVSAFPAYLSALHSRLPDAPLRRTVLQNLADEEGLSSPDRKPHSELWMDFATGMGATRSEVLDRPLREETRSLIAWFRNLMGASDTEAEPAAALAALYAYESRVPAISQTKAEGLRTHYAADAATTRYFTLHRTADVHHSQVWKDAIVEELEALPESERPASEAKAIVAATTAARALWIALDGVEADRNKSCNAKTVAVTA